VTSVIQQNPNATFNFNLPNETTQQVAGLVDVSDAENDPIDFETFLTKLKPNSKTISVETLLNKVRFWNQFPHIRIDYDQLTNQKKENIGVQVTKYKNKLEPTSHGYKCHFRCRGVQNRATTTWKVCNRCSSEEHPVPLCSEECLAKHRERLLLKSVVCAC